ncbi:phosphate acetyltransferase [Candidatus Ishikawella capsulata]|uniref:Phosphate acetyltransferase n=1 Tax=Candidatus Ishikawaella capsulata Mpkobe TaxID=476281 RepID=C5WC56_9ENTR|nr:phosphate acetyltransferase [Candidatus Ishikawaella capsulata]BAH82912.1 phosphate acetyltransferase [Candidatus Ishikawaella capsulata Mpkobe]
MPRNIMLVPTNLNVGLTSVILGIIRAMEKKGIKPSLFQPIAQQINSMDNIPDNAINILSKISDIRMAKPVVMSHVEYLLANNKQDLLMEEIINTYYRNYSKTSVLIIEGLTSTRQYHFFNILNYEIAKALKAEIIFVTSFDTYSIKSFKERLELILNSFGGKSNKSIIGAIINKVNAPLDKLGETQNYLSANFSNNHKIHINDIDIKNTFKNSFFPILGIIPWNFDLIATRVVDICHYLNARIINRGEIKTRRVKSVILCAHSLPCILRHFKDGALLVTSADRIEVLLAACLVAMNDTKIGAILLTGGYEINQHIFKLCDRALQTGLPIFMVNTNIWQTAINLQNFNLEVPADDFQRIEKVKEHISDYISATWIESLNSSPKDVSNCCPPLFLYQLTQLAYQAKKRIVLPEGNEPRIIEAASICANRNIAECILIGNSTNIKHTADQKGITIGRNIEIIDPNSIRKNYISRLVQLRKNKNMTELQAQEQLKDNVVLGTMMLEQDEVDGLVSGVIHSTANTIRPSLQLIKTAPNSTLVSSIFFMLLPDQVLVYGDCAINPDPNPEQLAEIAIQSADSAKFFGIDPRVAMISYSTGNSGTGSDVDKVREATFIAKRRRPDLIIDGPLQYDAAIVEEVAKSKAPHSNVAGRATVIIFPDLNTGNTTYKAVQRSAKLICIGPMLQGMRKPVNDLSRGALVDDIVYTIALTAIQSKQLEHAIPSD